jgi:serine/threonine protein kinase
MLLTDFGERAFAESACVTSISFRSFAHEDNTNGGAVNKKSLRNPFLVMELVPGRTLESLIHHLGSEHGTHITRQTLTIASALARALQHLHERKLVHRDVKPANIFLSNNQPGATPSVIKLGDFGVTKWGDFLAAATTGKLTMTAQQGLGTLKYMAPEQATQPKDVTCHGRGRYVLARNYSIRTIQRTDSPEPAPCLRDRQYEIPPQ